MNLLEINARIRQRPPFQMIERVTALEPGKSATGIKCVSVNEPYFQGHMPGLPIMPGVLLIESAAQLCSLVIEADGSDVDKVYVLLKVRDFKFVKPVVWNCTRSFYAAARDCISSPWTSAATARRAQRAN